MARNENFKRPNGILRLLFIAIAVLIQVAWIFSLGIWLSTYSSAIAAVLSLVALVISLALYGKKSNHANVVPWIMLVLAFPFLGVILWIALAQPATFGKMRKRISKAKEESFAPLPSHSELIDEIRAESKLAANQFYYVNKHEGYPIYRNEGLTFYPDASDAFAAQIEDVSKAEKFIFMEYHAIEDASSFAPMKAILKEKASSGVDVRILIDDMGSISFIDKPFAAEMEQSGCKIVFFNKMLPIAKKFMNNRDHRKITVVDGKVGHTGGYNLTDEYFNIINPYGHWKDSGIRLEGEAVNSLTATFLEMWRSSATDDTDPADFLLPAQEKTPEKPGYIAPYADNPLGTSRISENIYLNMIKSAEDYIYISTPYFILTDDMIRELCLAAARGIDVRILTPHIPDKKFVFRVTRSFYEDPVACGVKIYEYEPGFCHAKQWVSDDHIACVGTANMDFRSLYLHFENGVLFYDCDAVMDVKKDFVETFERDGLIQSPKPSAGLFHTIGRSAIRLVAPLL